jgi:hypothetical protein
MATSSIGRAVIIKDDETAKRLIAAMEYADKHPSDIEPYSIPKMKKEALEYAKCLSQRYQSKR